MKPRRFFGTTSRDVLRQVREALGEDALILSNAKVPGGIEIVALPGQAIGDLMAGARRIEPAPAAEAPAEPAPRPAVRPRPDAGGARALLRAVQAVGGRDKLLARAAASQPAASQPAASQPPQQPARIEPAKQPEPMAARAAPRQAPQAPVAPIERIEARAAAEATEPPSARMDERFADSLVAEMRTMRALLEHQLAGLAWSELARREPSKVAAMRTLLAAGFGGEAVRRLTDPMPELADEREAVRWLGSEINRNLLTAGSDNDIIERGGVYAIIGPTGVGKTTTTAKLAARSVVRHGADRVALLTTDTYRVGAHEQLRIYGRILGVTTCVVKDADDLKMALSDLRGKHMVLIDTIGMSQRDQMVAEQAATLSRCGGNVKRLLLLNATCNGETLEDVVRCYQPGGLDGCIVTKVDEAGSIGAALDVLIRHRLVLHFVANGQRVPEDLHAANRQYLIHRALRTPAEDSPLALGDTEYSLMMAAANAHAQRNAPLGLQAGALHG